MATPSSRATMKEFCLRRLGKPVIEINIDDDQMDDRIDEALLYFQDYHFDGVETTWLKHQITQTEIDNHFAKFATVGKTWNPDTESIE